MAQQTNIQKVIAQAVHAQISSLQSMNTFLGQAYSIDVFKHKILEVATTIESEKEIMLLIRDSNNTDIVFAEIIGTYLPDKNQIQLAVQSFVFGYTNTSIYAIAEGDEDEGA